METKTLRDGLVTHVISAEPTPGYEPSSREAKVLTQLHATLWISKDDHGWVKAEMETVGDTKWGIMLKLHEGTQIRLRQRRLNDEIWLPDNWYVRLRAKAALVFKYNGEITGSYSNYRRFTTDSTVIDTDAAADR